jgi:hypothetical protein
MHTGGIAMKVVLAMAFVLAVLCGCRREDVRTCEISIPGLTRENRETVVRAFYLPEGPVADGVFIDSLAFDFGKKTLTLRYDSMKIAQTNLRMLIAEKGIDVAFPAKTTGRAGH